MMGLRLCLVCVAAAVAATGQVQLYTFDGTTEKPVTAITDLGTVAAGDARLVRFRARNNSAAAVALSAASVTLAGPGFNWSPAPALPYTLAPANYLELRVSFQAPDPGVYSATLTANGAQTMMRASVVPSATVTVVDNSVGSVLAAGASIDFGRIQKGTSISRQIRIGNGNASAIAIQSCGVSGTAFTLTGLKCPVSIAPNDALLATLTFNPSGSGAQQGTFSLDTRSFALTGVAYDPPMPRPSISFAAPLVSATQPKLTVQLAETSQTTGAGTVTLSFQPASTNLPDDPFIRFISGSRTLSFAVKDGDRTAQFPAGVDTTFQTGTTAGTIVFRVQLADYDQQFSFQIAPAAIYADRATAARRTGNLDVSVTGFDNTGTAGRFSFTFYDSSGKAIQPGAIEADWSETFFNYFRKSGAGGSFTLRATFPVSGDAMQVASVDVRMTNSVGQTGISRLAFSGNTNLVPSL